MAKKSTRPKVPRHLEIFEDDWNFLLEEFGPQSPTRLGVSVAIREIISKRCKELRERRIRRHDTEAPPAELSSAFDEIFKEVEGEII